MNNKLMQPFPDEEKESNSIKTYITRKQYEKTNSKDILKLRFPFMGVFHLIFASFTRNCT